MIPKNQTTRGQSPRQGRPRRFHGLVMSSIKGEISLRMSHFFMRYLNAIYKEF